MQSDANRPSAARVEAARTPPAADPGEDGAERSLAEAALLARHGQALRRPMYGILGMTSLLRETRLSAEQREYVEILQDSGEALIALLEDWTRALWPRRAVTTAAAATGFAGDEEPKGATATAEQPAERAMRSPATWDILVAEDNPLNLLLARRVLEARGHRVTVARDGASALEAFAAGDFDAVLLDLRMPGIDGFEVAGAIRQREDGEHRIPIVALTAETRAATRRRCLATGMDAVLTKPLDPELLLETLERLIAGAG